VKQQAKIKYPTTLQTKQAKLERDLKKLDSSYNPTKSVKFTPDTSLPNVIEEEASSNEETEVYFVFNASLASDPGLPNSYDEAMARPDRKEWMKAIKKEFENFQARGVWKIVKRNVVNKRALMTRGRITGKTVYKARLVVNGYERI
jgi:hypothetical protein